MTLKERIRIEVTATKDKGIGILIRKGRIKGGIGLGFGI